MDMKEIDREIGKINQPIEVPGIEENPVITIDALTRQASSVLAVSTTLQGFQIETDEEFRTVEEELTVVRTRKDALEAERVRLTKPLLDTKRNIDTLFKRPMAMLAQAEEIIKACLLRYREKYNMERQEAEAKRLEAVRQASKEMADALVKGDYAAAEQAQESVEVAKRTYVPMSDLKAQHGEQVTWKFNVTDFPELVKAAAAGEVPIEYLQPNMTEIGKVVRALRENANIPGVMAYGEKSLRVRKK